MTDPSDTNLDNELRRLAQVRDIAQQQIFASAKDAHSIAKEMWVVLSAILAATVYITLWMSRIDASVESNTKHIRTLWVNLYHVEP